MPFKSNLPEIMQINVFSFNYNNKIRTYYKTYNKHEKHKKNIQLFQQCFH